MKSAPGIVILFAWMTIQRLVGFDYTPPIQQSGEDYSLDFGTGGRLFHYSIVSRTDAPPAPQYYRVSLALTSQGVGRVLRAGPNRIQFSESEDISSSSAEYRTEFGVNVLLLGGYDVTPLDGGWSFIDRFNHDGRNWWRRLTEVLIGLRFQLDDGIHHGWIRFSRADTHFTTVFQPQEYDWNPIPDAPIGAGQPPVIPITSEVTDQGLHLSWSPSLASWTLESTGALSDDAVWIPVPEATGYEAWLEFPDASRYFRLRRP